MKPKDKNCLDCLYANYEETGITFADLLDKEYRKCEHPNSSYYNELVSDNKICRLFIDEKEYFRNKDLKDKIEHLRNKKR